MNHDQIIGEVRAIRKRLAAERGYDIRALYEEAERGSCSYFARDGTGRQYLVDDFVPDQGLPPEITSLLTV